MTIPVLNPEGGFRRLRIDFQYDGSNFQGWAKQPDLRTIQGVLEETIGKIVRSSVDCVTAGRTDADRVKSNMPQSRHLHLHKVLQLHQSFSKTALVEFLFDFQGELDL